MKNKDKMINELADYLEKLFKKYKINVAFDIDFNDAAQSIIEDIEVNMSHGNINFSERIRKCFSATPSFYKSKWNDAIDIKKNPITNKEKSLIPVIKEYLSEVDSTIKLYHGEIPDGIARQISVKYSDKCDMTEEQMTILTERLKAAGLV